jgi:predicted transcriptional regulator
MWGAIIGLASAAVSAYSSKKKSDAESNANAANAESMEEEKKFQEWRTATLLKKQQQYTNSVMAAQRTAFAKNGIRLDTGTSQQLAESTLAQAAEDASYIRMEGEFNAKRASSAGSLYSQQAKDAQTAGMISGGTTLLTGGWQFAQSMGWFS